MKRVLLIGQEPETVDFSDPALPPGLNAEKIHAGITVGMQKMAEHGWDADLCLFGSADSARSIVESKLSAATYDCIVIGAGVRLPPRSLATFEAILNAVHKLAPSAFIAFNTKPEDTGMAAARWIEDN